MRSSRQVLVERSLQRLVGGHRDPVDLAAPAAGVELGQPGGDGRRIAGADFFDLGRQLLAGFEVMKPHLPFQRQVVFDGVEHVEDHEVVPVKEEMVEARKDVVGFEEEVADQARRARGGA